MNKMGSKSRSIDDLIQSMSYHNLRPLILHGYALPFVALYLVWLYIWLCIQGYEENYEVGLVGIAVIGFIQILTSLFCLWSVSVKVLLTTSPVSILMINIMIHLWCYSGANHLTCLMHHFLHLGLFDVPIRMCFPLLSISLRLT